MPVRPLSINIMGVHYNNEEIGYSNNSNDDIEFNLDDENMQNDIGVQTAR